jgi:hypothetical protein
MLGKEVTPKTFSRHNQKTNLCNLKLFPAATTKKTQRHNWHGREVSPKTISATTKKLTQQHNWKNVPPAHA